MTSPKKRFFLFLPLLLLGIFLVGSQTAVAQTKTFNWEDWHSDITLLENGDLQVVETQTLNFQGQPFTFGFRTIQTGASGNNDGLTNISVREGDIVYEESRSNAPYTFEVSESGDETTIRWYFEPALGQQTYEFSYIVEGGTIVGTSEEGDGDQVYWTIVPDDHPARVDHTSATITLPEGIEPQRYFDTNEYLVAGFVNESESDAVATSVSADGRIIDYDYPNPLLQGSSLAARVQYPHGILPVATPQWQRSMQINDTLNTVFMGFALLLCMVGPLAVLLLWYLRGRDPQLTVVVPDYITEPPDDLPPAVVGTLVDEKADMQDIISTLVDLARRGYVLMEEEEKGRNHVFKRTEKSWKGLRPFERQFLKDVFRNKQEQSLDSLRYKFSSKLPNLRTMLYEELVDDKLVPKSPQSTRRNYWGLTGAVFVIAVIGFIGFSAVFSNTITSAVCLPLALFATAIALAFTSTHMPTKTAKGVEAAAKWEAFKTYLKNVEDHQDLAQTSEIFEKYLAYAIAFGLERTWIRKFSQVPTTPIPGWYMPYGGYYGGYHGGLGGSSARPSASGSGGSIPAPSLEGMSGSMTGGLAAMSGGLTRMLNSSSTVMKSVKPSSSSGSSGGFSGGFSGGGGFSAGGGGSAGFG